jgi:hypothetical protein
MASRLNRPGLWFPAGLLLLLLLALPGLVLLALNVFGRQAAVNAWLRQRLGLSYDLALPSWAALLLLLVPPLLLLLYFLKMKRQPRRVSSTFLWRRSIEDVRVNSLFQWLRENVLLLLQLLAVLLLLLGVLAFQVHGRTTTGKHYILLIDSSASMAATDVDPTRLEAARAEALAEIDRHGEDDPGMVIEFNARATVRQPFVADRELLRSAVRRIRQTQQPTNIEDALAQASARANPLKATEDQAVRPAGEDPAQARTYVSPEGIAAEVHLFSDGNFPPPPADFAAGNLDLHYHRIGRPGADAVDNVGIVACNALRDEQQPGRVAVFARVLNFRARPCDVKVELEWRVQGEDGFKLLDQPLSLPARTTRPADPLHDDPGGDTPGEGVVTFELAGVDDASVAVLNVRLAGHHDDFPLDDQAWLVVGVVRKARVLIVTDGNDLLHHFFDQEAVARVAGVQYLRPADLGDEAKYGRPARDGAFDLVVFDRCAPKAPPGRPAIEALPRANTFFIDAVPSPWEKEKLPPLKNVVIRNPSSPHPLMRHLTGLDEIAFTRAFRFELDPRKDPRVPPRIVRLLETDGDTAVLFTLPLRDFTDVVLAFPLVTEQGAWATTWPLKLSFPLFLRNVLYVLGRVSDAASEEPVRPGEVLAIQPDRPVNVVQVFDPAALAAPGRQPPTEVPRGPRGEFLYNDTEQVGLYRATWEGGERLFAVNLLDADESNLQPQDAVQLGSQRLEAQTVRGQPWDTWPWLVLAALLVLLLEWALYHRRYLK